MSTPTRILFVCLGNICRSPTAEGLFRHHVQAAGLQADFEIDSAGTGAWHAGEPPDRRMTQAAKKQGYALSGQARAVTPRDFGHFDHIFAMDADNLSTLLERCPAEHKAKVQLFRDYDPEARGASVPDPYYGGPAGFDEVVAIVDRTSGQILEALSAAGSK